MKKFIATIIFVFVVQTSFSSEEINFSIWLDNFKSEALKKGISQDTINKTFTKVRYLEMVIEYDRKQPEFFEDTNTYIKKRATRSKVIKAKKFYFKNKTLFDEVEKKFKVEKELLLSLWGIETNFGKHVGRMDIISSLATLSFDKRRSKFFSNQLMILLELIDDNLIKIDTLYGSWAGAFGNFQFMPSTIKNYAIDYDKNSKIELKKSLYDSVASAANYINKVGWKFGSKCFYQVKLMKPVKKKYIKDPDSICDITKPEDSMLDQPQLLREELIGLASTFGLYQTLPKSKWKWIKKAEPDTDEAKKLRVDLLKEYKETVTSNHSGLSPQDTIDA